jgi:hypothetical protein
MMEQDSRHSHDAHAGVNVNTRISLRGTFIVTIIGLPSAVITALALIFVATHWQATIAFSGAL